MSKERNFKESSTIIWKALKVKFYSMLKLLSFKMQKKKKKVYSLNAPYLIVDFL